MDVASNHRSDDVEIRFQAPRELAEVADAYAVGCRPEQLGVSVDSSSRKVGIGGSQAQRILMAIGSDCVTARQVQRLLAGQVSMRAIESHLSDLHRRGFVSLSKKGGASAYSLTSLGVYQLPRAEAWVRDDWRPLQRLAAPPRRSGSGDASRLPSVFAGRVSCR